MSDVQPTAMTRDELHAQVWREPRSRLAKRWGISDVAIGKLCVKQGIPAPPPGYWTKKAAGSKVAIKPLPMRLPGQRAVVELRARPYYERWDPPVDITSDITQPTYTETVDEVVHSALRRLGPIRFRRDLVEPHRGLRRVMKSEETRAQRSKEQSWSFDKPRFAEPKFQRQLRVFNSLFFILDAINASCEVRENDIWIQGLGQLHYLVAHISIGSSIVQLQFLEPDNPKGSRDLPRSSATTLRVGQDPDADDVVDDPARKIERRLDDIVKTILFRAETVMRSADFFMYERTVERKRKMLEQIAEEQRAEEASRIAVIKARQQAIRKEITEAAANLRHAHDIRSLVEAMASHPDWVGEGRSDYAKWSAVALAQADSIDPMRQPISQCFSAWELAPMDCTD